MPVFLTGATGYVGGRLLSALRARREEVRVLTRDASRLGPTDAEVVEADVRDDLADALTGASVAYYLVHSLGSEDFGDADRAAARAFAQSAEAAGVGRIVYLGGLGRGELSPHLASRQEVGRILRASRVPTIELRASVVIGDGSVSFDTFRTLAQLPVAVLPDWVDTPSQPIAVDDVVPYRAILEQLGGTALTLPAPGVLAGLAALLKPLQPERARVVSDLLDSLRVDTSVHDDAALRAFSVRPRGLADAVAR